MTAKLVTLTNSTLNGTPITANFAPLQGMNLVSLKYGDIELLDLSTQHLFNERFAGLGALIGPHFHHRPNPPISPKITAETFPHITRQPGIFEPFSHGIARYVPWKYEASATQIYAVLQGKDIYKGACIKDYEGQDFVMRFNIKLTHEGLILFLSIESASPSIVGFHYYYNNPPGSYVEAHVIQRVRCKEGWVPLSSDWYTPAHKKLHFALSQEADFGFHCIDDLHHLDDLIILYTPSYSLHLEYTSSNLKDSSWQLYHPQDASFVCIEPLSALNPKEPTRNHSNIQLKITVFK